MLCNEPYCWPPSEVARLTDYQALELILRPAVRRARDARRKRDGKGKGRTRAGQVPSKSEYVAIGMRLGYTGKPEELEREYDRMKAADLRKKKRADRGRNA